MPLLFGELSGAPAWVPAVLLVTLSLAVGFNAIYTSPVHPLLAES